MPKTLDAAATFNDPAERLDIALMPVKSAQLAAVGYHPASQTLAVTFTRGSGAVYHYAGVSAALHAELLAADSIGRFFGARIQSLPFKKFATAPAAAR